MLINALRFSFTCLGGIFAVALFLGFLIETVDNFKRKK